MAITTRSRGLRARARFGQCPFSPSRWRRSGVLGIMVPGPLAAPGAGSCHAGHGASLTGRASRRRRALGFGGAQLPLPASDSAQWATGNAVSAQGGFAAVDEAPRRRPLPRVLAKFPPPHAGPGKCQGRACDVASGDMLTRNSHAPLQNGRRYRRPPWPDLDDGMGTAVSRDGGGSEHPFATYVAARRAQTL